MLIDIEELVLKVRSSVTREAVSEAVACYKVGAYRACVVGTWIALVYDLIDKFRDLALANDKRAAELIQKFESIQFARKTDEALKFERDVLSIARDEFELISHQELADLQRLFEDRNRFAHPNLNQDFESLSCPAELARTHLRVAIEHVMQRPPVQGRAALVSIQAAVDSPYFPVDPDKAFAALAGTPLQRARKQVVKEFYLGCISSLIREDLIYERFFQRLASARACHRMHPEIVREIVQGKIPGILDKADDKSYPYIFAIMIEAPEYITCISDSLKVRLSEFIERLPTEYLQILNYSDSLDFCEGATKLRIRKITEDELQRVVATRRQISELVADHAVSIFENATSWAQANKSASVMAESMLSIIGRDLALRVLHAGSNSEVAGSYGYPNLLSELRGIGRLSHEEIIEFLDANNLQHVKQRLPDVEEDIPF